MHNVVVSKPGRAAAPLRRMAEGSCAALALAAAVLLAAVTYGVLYLALEGERTAGDMVLDLAPRALCAVLPVCSS